MLLAKAPKYYTTPYRIAQGQILKDKRIDLKLSREKVCEAIGISFPTLCNWELGHNSPTCEHGAQLAKLYQCPIQELFPNEEISA